MSLSALQIYYYPGHWIQSNMIHFYLYDDTQQVP